MVRKKQVFSEQKISKISDENFTHNLVNQTNSENISNAENSNLFKNSYCLTLCLEVNDIQLANKNQDNDD